MRTAVLTLLISVALVAMSCADDPTLESRAVTREGTPGEWPVGRIVDHREFGDISFDPAPGTPWTTLVDLSVFDGFWSGMTGEEAVEAMGPADEHYERNGERYWVYQKPGAEIVVALKHKGSLFAGRWWRLEAKFDPPANPADLFHPSVVQSLPEADNRYSIVIMNNENKPGISALVEDGKVVEMDWINNPGSQRTVFWRLDQGVSVSGRVEVDRQRGAEGTRRWRTFDGGKLFHRRLCRTVSALLHPGRTGVKVFLSRRTFYSSRRHDRSSPPPHGEEPPSAPAVGPHPENDRPDLAAWLVCSRYAGREELPPSPTPRGRPTPPRRMARLSRGRRT